MRRWNGWGSESVDYPLPPSAADYLVGMVGKGASVPDASLESVLESVPTSRLPPHPLVRQDPTERLMHARGQSLPDWIALRSGNVGAFPDGVAYPDNDEDVRSLIDYARETGACLIPYGGGTSVVGHINPRIDQPPSLTVDMQHMSQLLELDECSLHATFGTGVRGPNLETMLESHGYTLGHYPQSFELSTLGGWIATRSSGQQSLHYGRIEDHFAGGHVETPQGPMDLPCFPATAAGPDLRHLILGSEGRLGIITRATIRIRPLPETDQFHAIFFRDWASGMDAVRTIAQEEVPLSMMRLSDELETQTTLMLAGRERLVSLADRGLRALDYGDLRCLLLIGATGSPRKVKTAIRQATALARRLGGLFTGAMIGKMWRKSRFTTPYLRNTLWNYGYALDTLETAVPWAKVPATVDLVRQALRHGLEPVGARVLAFAHLSHIYRNGASTYFTYLFPRAAAPDETLSKWQTLKTLASEAIVEQGGTISHQHGVGRDHAPYLTAEKGSVGMDMLTSLVRETDPDQLINPGIMLPDREIT
ncbi:MAG: FAD-binding oxidoreductase [Anaerolineales bacterium]